MTEKASRYNVPKSQRPFKIIARSKVRPYNEEELDSARDPEEARGLIAYYRKQFSDEWIIKTDPELPK